LHEAQHHRVVHTVALPKERDILAYRIYFDGAKNCQINRFATFVWREDTFSDDLVDF
jgi:hypothetical protein